MLPRSLDVSFRTAYAQARELALAQAQVSLVSPGSLQVETRRGGRFVYRYRYDATGKRRADYLGPEAAPETTRRVEAARLEIDDHAVLAGYARDLRRIGLYSADNSTITTVAALFNAGIFGSGGVLVGTHAFGVLLNDLGLVMRSLPLTEDVDVARARRIEIAALPRGGLLALLQETGLPFHEVPGQRRGAPSTSFKVRGRKLKVDLLVPSDTRPFEPVEVPELGAYATGLPSLRYLLEGAARSVLIGRERIVPVVVPHAGRFCLHKLALFALRTGEDNPKRDKDVTQAGALASVLAEGSDFLLAEARDGASAALTRRASSGARRALALQPSLTEPAREWLRKLAEAD